ncbi:MAG: histidinol-phosphatase HisJ family protein [Clostridia bacterium]|nr:histidinol-phosphatase HisJ family protein [Clostridia bacterium]
MYIHDSHVHTEFSHDTTKKGPAGFDLTVRTAIEQGLSEISICDHCDIDDILDGIYPEFPAEEIKAAVLAARETYGDRIRINFGVELGQPHVRPEEARALIEKCGFDFVVGSLHNLRLCPDFRFFRYDLMGQPQLDYIVKRVASESREIVETGLVSSLAHLDYIHVKIESCGASIDMNRYADDFAELFRAMIRRGVALEVNTSSLKSHGFTYPSAEFCALYRDLGGERIVFGSDAHTANGVGQGIEEAAASMRALGFKSQTVIRDGKPTEIEL